MGTLEVQLVVLWNPKQTIEPQNQILAVILETKILVLGLDINSQVPSMVRCRAGSGSDSASLFSNHHGIKTSSFFRRTKSGTHNSSKFSCRLGKNYTVPYHTIPSYTLPYSTILYHTVPYHLILYPTLLFYTIPYHTIPYHTIPYHTIPYHTIPCHAMPYHTILYILYSILYTINYILYSTLLLALRGLGLGLGRSRGPGRGRLQARAEAPKQEEQLRDTAPGAFAVREVK